MFLYLDEFWEEEMSVKIQGEEDDVSEPNNSSSLSLVYVLPKYMPTVLLKSWFSSSKTFGAFSGS